MLWINGCPYLFKLYFTARVLQDSAGNVSPIDRYGVSPWPTGRARHPRHPAQESSGSRKPGARRPRPPRRCWELPHGWRRISTGRWPAGDGGNQRVAGERPRFTGEEYEAVESAIDAARQAPHVQAALRAMPDGDRKILELVAYTQLSPSEVALTLHISPNLGFS